MPIAACWCTRPSGCGMRAHDQATAQGPYPQPRGTVLVITHGAADGDDGARHLRSRHRRSRTADVGQCAIPGTRIPGCGVRHRAGHPCRDAEHGLFVDECRPEFRRAAAMSRCPVPRSTPTTIGCTTTRAPAPRPYQAVPSRAISIARTTSSSKARAIPRAARAPQLTQGFYVLAPAACGETGSSCDFATGLRRRTYWIQQGIE